MGLVRSVRPHKIGRKQRPEVIVAGLSENEGTWNSQRWLERIAELGAIGVTAVTLNVSGKTRTEWCENAERYGVDVIAKLPQQRSAREYLPHDLAP